MNADFNQQISMKKQSAQISEKHFRIMKILITGAKGFIGKNLLAELHNIQLGKAKQETLISNMMLFEFDIDY